MKRGFAHSNNPKFSCQESVLLLPFGRKSYLPALVRRFDAEAIPLDETTDREVYTILHHSTSITVIFSGMGAPAVVNALEMANANGGKRIILFGACGGISPNIQIGDLLIPRGAVRGEGASRYYAPIEFPAATDVDLTYRLMKTAKDQDIASVHHGVVYSTDASYRQGPELYETYKDLVLGVECEFAAVSVVSACLHLQAAALFFCTDNVTLTQEVDRTYKGLNDERVRRGFETGLDIVVHVLSQFGICPDKNSAVC